MGLVTKKPKGYRMVTSFGHIAAHAKNPPVPMDSMDTVLRNLSSWKYLICADIKSAYHQIPLAFDSLKYAGVSSPYRGTRVYTRAAMGMPGSEVALKELTSALFGHLQRENVLSILMDDIYVGANTIEDLLSNWKQLLSICKQANIRL